MSDYGDECDYWTPSSRWGVDMLEYYSESKQMLQEHDIPEVHFEYVMSVFSDPNARYTWRTSNGVRQSVKSLHGENIPIDEILVILNTQVQMGLLQLNPQLGEAGLYGLRKVEKAEDMNRADELISEAIHKAICHTRLVVERSHIKAENRIERISHFLTDLRRELHYMAAVAANGKMSGEFQGIVDSLCRKELWFDIGILEENPRYERSNMNHPKDQIRKWVNMADSLSQDDYEFEVDRILQELNSGLSAFHQKVEQAKYLNAEGEKVVESLCKVFE